MRNMLKAGYLEDWNTTKRSADLRKAAYVQLNINRLMNSAGLCAALACWPGGQRFWRSSTAHNPLVRVRGWRASRAVRGPGSIRAGRW